jgi:N-acyl-L-homoserine lactone synthetase
MSLIVNLVTDERDLAEIYKLRYKVFYEEWGHERPESHSSRVITDLFDERALHFAARDNSQKIVGAIMLILNSSEGYPIEKYCELNINTESLPRDKIAEISRLVIHRDYRRRAEDKYIYGPDEERRSIGSFDFSSEYPNNRIYYRRAEDKYRNRYGSRRTADLYIERRKRHEVVISLYKAIYQESKRRQLTHWYAMMTKGIALLLNRFGLVFQAIGDPVDYHGIRTPYLGEIAEIEREMSTRVPELYEEFISGL